MKRRAKQSLSIRRETIRSLSGAELKEAGGGFPSTISITTIISIIGSCNPLQAN
jgi:hypothetical protein